MDSLAGQQIVKGPMTPSGVDAVCRSLKKAVIERAMNVELSDHQGCEPGGEKPEAQSNHRNGRQRQDGDHG